MLNKNAPISFTIWLPKNARHATQIGLVLPTVCSLQDSCWYEQITLSTKLVELLCLLSFSGKIQRITKYSVLYQWFMYARGSLYQSSTKKFESRNISV